MDISLNSNKHHYWNTWLFFGFLYVLMIVLGSLLKVQGLSASLHTSDKVIHFIAYFLLVGWFVQLFPAQITRILIVLSAVALGLILEFLQGTISYRSFQWFDALANTLGALSAYLLAGTALSSLLLIFDHKLYQLIHRAD